MVVSTRGEDADVTGGFVPNRPPKQPDDIEEGEIPIMSIVSDGWKKKKKKNKKEVNFKRKQRKRAATQAFIDSTPVMHSLLRKEEARANAYARILTDTKWHVSLAHDGMRIASDVLMLFLIPLAICPLLLLDVAKEIDGIPLGKFKAMGGQPGMFTQARRQYQFPATNSLLPSSQLLVQLKSFLALCGWTLVRAMFCIVGGTHQFMHTDRGHYHSISLFVCIVARRVRFGRRGGKDFEVSMNAGDVLAFNGLVWHSGLDNNADSCVLFMYFDREAFYLTKEMRADLTADQSRFGFTKMLSENEWQQYSASCEHDPDEYDCVTLANLSMLPTSLMRTFVPASEFTLDK